MIFRAFIPINIVGSTDFAYLKERPNFFKIVSIWHLLLDSIGLVGLSTDFRFHIAYLSTGKVDFEVNLGLDGGFLKSGLEI